MYHERRWYTCSNCGAEADVDVSAHHKPPAPNDWKTQHPNVHWCGACAQAVEDAQRRAAQEALVARAAAGPVPA